PEYCAERFDYEFVILAHREAGDGDAADDSCAGYGQGKGSAVGCVVGERETLAVVDCLPLLFFAEANSVGAAMKTRDDIALSADPFDIVGSGGVHRGVEERLAESPYIDYNGEAAF